MRTPTYAITGLLVILAVFLGGCAGSPQEASTGEFVDDRAITTRVKTQLLRDEQVSGLDVNVDTFKGTVQLNGFVDSAEQKQRAEAIAKGVAGVQRVQNNLSVKGQ